MIEDALACSLRVVVITTYSGIKNLKCIISWKPVPIVSKIST